MDRETFEIVDHAAVIRGWPRSKIVELGALDYARKVLEQAAGSYAALRRAMRKAKAQAGGLAKAAKKRNT